MVLVLVFLPLILALAMALSLSAQEILLKIYVPCLLLVPLYLTYTVRGVAYDPACLVGALLGTWGLASQFTGLRFSLLDLCVLLNALSVFYADSPHRSFNISTIVLIGNLFTCAFPYLIGRTLIEQTGIRVRLARVLVTCVSIVAIIGIWEFRMSSNPFLNAVKRINPGGVGWITMIRWGFARIAGPYGHAITAGMVFSVGLILQIWLLSTGKWRVTSRRMPLWSRNMPFLVTAVVALGLFMSQSRGPWIGCGLGLIIATIGLSKNRRLAATIALSLMILYVGIAAVVVDRYTDTGGKKTNDQEQENATYRRQLFDTYRPMIVEGGLWGSGSPHQLPGGGYGYSANQTSIDDQYLLVTVSQGYVGISLFVAMICLAVWRLVLQCARLKRREDIIFAFCMLGAIVGTSFTITTVYLDQPMLNLLFLLFGWSESIQSTKGDLPTPDVKAPSYVFERVYT